MKTKQIIFFFIALLFPVYSGLAQTLENIPGQEANATDSDLVGFLGNMYNFGISITGILAIFMIGLGAFSYMITSAGNSAKMMDAKETIQNALIGLIIALTAYLFLYVINPDLVQGTLRAPEEAVAGVVSLPDTPYWVDEDSLVPDGSACRTSAPGGPGGGGIINSSSPSCSSCQNGSYVDQIDGVWVAYCGTNDQ